MQLLKPQGLTMESYQHPERLLDISIDNIILSLTVIELSGVDILSQPFSYSLTVLSDTHLLEECNILGNDVSFRVGTISKPQYFHGIINTIVQNHHQKSNQLCFTISISPSLCKLKYEINQRVFYEQSIIEIFKSIVDLYLFLPYNLDNIVNNYPKIDYVSQNNESDFDFLHRLLASENIYYYFTHSPQRHILHLVDNNSFNGKLPQEITYTKTATSSNNLLYLQKEWQPRENEVEQIHYNPASPHAHFKEKANLSNSNNTIQTSKTTSHCNIPVRFKNKDSLAALNKKQLHSTQLQAQTIRAKSALNGLFSGQAFTLSVYDPVLTSEDCYLYKVIHKAYDLSGTNIEESETNEMKRYDNIFHAFTTTQPFAANNYQQEINDETNLSKSPGTDYAIINTSNDDLLAYRDNTDKLPVSLTWDDQKIQFMSEINHQWASHTYGFHTTPHNKQKIIIAYEHGQPEKPIIIGTTSSPHSMPAFTPKDTPYRLGLKSRQGNMLLFEDDNPYAGIYLNAHNDLVIHVDGKQKTNIGQDYQHTVRKGNYKKQVSKTFSLSAKQNLALQCHDNGILLMPGEIILQGTLIELNR